MNTTKVNSKLARGLDYFAKDFPLRIGRNQSTQAPHPKKDLTEIEHHHDFSELIIINKGFGVQSIDGIDIPTAAGDVFLLHELQAHYFHSRRNLEIINIMYIPKGLGIPEDELRQIPGYCALFDHETVSKNQHRAVNRMHLNSEQLLHAETLSEQIRQECDERTPGYIPLARAKTIQLFTYLSRIYEGDQPNERQALLRVGNAIEAIEKNFSKDWTMDELMEITCMSKSSLFTRFKEATGHSPNKYLTHIRIQHAVEMLRSSEHSITEIAFAAGFNDSNYFTRQFKKACGMTPRQFRSHQHDTQIKRN